MFFRIHLHLIGMCFLLAFTIGIHKANAQEATPSHVFQVVSTLNNQLGLMHKHNETQPPQLTINDNFTNLKPRHVFQNARMVYRKVQTLRYLSGLETSPLPPLPDQEIKPGDVKMLSTKILEQTNQLNDVFGIKKSVEPSPFVEGKKPSDVYAELLVAGHKLEALGLPKVIPNDVYQVSLEVHKAVAMIVEYRGQTPKTIEAIYTGKKPNDVFDLTHQLFQVFKQKSQSVLNVDVPGGFIVPDPRNGNVTPQNVIFLMNQLLGEIHSVLAAMGANPMMEEAPVQFGKTPSQVYDSVASALSMLEDLT